MNKKTVLVLIFVLFMLQALTAVQVKKIEKTSFEDFSPGSLLGLTLDSQGRLSLGPRFKTMNGPEEEFYLAIDQARNGDIIIGSGQRGNVHRLNADGSVELLFQAAQPDIYALLTSGNGDVFVASSPQGRLFRIDKEGKSQELFRPEERFIWDLKEDAEGNLVVATGNSGAVYLVNRSGEAQKILSPADAHLVTLHLAQDGAILVGSGDRGLLYQIKNRKVRVLFESPLEEIKGICEDAEGNLYFAAVKSTAQARDAQQAGLDTIFRPAEERRKPQIKEKSIVYMARPDGSVETLWSSEEEYVYTLCYDEKRAAVLAGTGHSGRIYSISKDKSFSVYFESESAQVFRIKPAVGGGLLVIGNNTPVILRLEDTLNNSGTYVSDVFDARIPSRFGRLDWSGEWATPGNVSLFIRLGNSSIPDESWLSWSAPFTDAANSSINLSGYRFFQLKVVINAASAAEKPFLDRYTAYYLEANQAPAMRSISVRRPDIASPSVETTDKKEENRLEKQLEVNWQSMDPNQDALKFDLFLRRQGSREWIPVKENLRENKFQLAMEMFADGIYQLRVVADDSLSNPPGMSKKTSILSKPFVIDSTAPVVRDLTVKGDRVTFTVVDETSIVAQVLYSLDGRDWFPLFPLDLINDSKIEKYDTSIPGLAAAKILYLKVSDEFANAKVFQKEL